MYKFYISNSLRLYVDIHLSLIKHSHSNQALAVFLVDPIILKCVLTN